MRFLLLPLVLTFCLVAACAPVRSKPPLTQPLTLNGWFHTVWAERAHYWLVDDRQQWTELQISDDVTLPPGAPQALEGRRVVLSGTAFGAAPRVVRVTSLTLSPERR